MGVPKLHKMFMKVIVSALTNNVSGLFGLLMDLNGFIHKCSGMVYGYGKDLFGNELTSDIKALIRQRLKTSSGRDLLKAEFLNALGPALEEVIIKQLRPSDVLIIAIDGRPPFAKVVQQRSRRNDSGFTRHSYNPTSDTVNVDEKFDTAYLTAGTQFMRDVSATIRAWINANKSRLPYYTLFSGSDYHGEGEHKIFKMLDELRVFIVSNDTTVTKKDKDATFRSQRWGLYGLDGDLGILGPMRDYNFIWIREQFSIKKIDIGTNLDAVRGYVINEMNPYETPTEDLEKHIKGRIMCDFAFLSHFIGDDFVPAMFPLTANIKLTLDRFMQKYKVMGSGRFLLNEYGDINVDNLTELIPFLQEVEKEMYELRQEINNAEVSLQQNFGNEEIINKVRALRESIGIKVDNRETYTPAPILNLSYEEYVNYWKTVLIRPALMSSRLAQSNKISYINGLDQSLIDRESDLTCQDYLTGLQWNIKYYMGFEMGNWYYKKVFPPTIHALTAFLQAGKYVPQVVIRQPTDPVISVTQCLVTALNPNFSYDVLKSFFKTDKAYNSAIINCAYINTMFPKTISYSSVGRYHSDEHTRVVLLPPVIFEDILKIIPSTKNEVNDTHMYNFINGGLETSFPRLLKSSVGFGREDDTKIFNKENPIRGPGSPNKPRASSPIGGNKPAFHKNISFGEVKPPSGTFAGNNSQINNTTQPILSNKMAVFGPGRGGRGGGRNSTQSIGGRGGGRFQNQGRGSSTGNQPTTNVPSNQQTNSTPVNRGIYRPDRYVGPTSNTSSMKVGKIKEIVVSKGIGGGEF